MELPYYYKVNSDNNNNINNNENNNTSLSKRQHQNSYGIICISRDGYIVINKSPPYIKTYIRKNKRNSHKSHFVNIRINSNEKYSLILSLFPNSSLEGEYTLPKGKIDEIDQKNKIYTKVREFIEETKLSHPYLLSMLNNHYNNLNFKSFLNDEKYILRESWIGLDNNIYNCEYSVFVINSINELIPISNKNNIVPFDYFLKNFDIYRNCNNFYKKYKQSSKLDSQKKTLFLSINEGIDLLNKHKINIYQNKSNDSRLQINDVKKYIKDR